MTQKKTESIAPPFEDFEVKRSTRIENAPPDLFDPNTPRIGRRESEPHSAEITYIYDVLTTNFPESRAIWDLHHYFVGKKGVLKGVRIDIQFDISFFKDFKILRTLSSYDASRFNERVPDMVINILSKSTWKTDLSEHLETCKELGIAVYIVFSPFNVTSNIYQPPFLRVYILQEDGSYKQEDLRKVTLNEGEEINKENILDIGKRLPFRIGLMKLKQEHEEGDSLYRLIFITPLESIILSTSKEKEVNEAQNRAKEAEKRAKELERELKKYREKFGELL